MKIREVGQKAENLLEQGEEVKQQQASYQRAVVTARSHLIFAYAMLDAASQTDEEGNPNGDIGYARAQVFAAENQLSSAERGLSDTTLQLEGVNRKKKDIIREVDSYTEGEGKNLSKLHELQNKKFAGNASAFIADLVARMNSGEVAKARLLQSLGQNSTARTFSANGNIGSAGGIGAGNDNQIMIGSDDAGNEFADSGNSRVSFTAHQLELYRSLKRQLQIAQLLDMRQKLTQAQALDILIGNSDAQCNLRASRTPNQILSDMKISIRENWMNNFNADQWKAILPEKMYKERLELFRTGLAYEIGKEVADKLDIGQLEQFSRERNLAFMRDRKMNEASLIDTAKRLQASSTNSFERSQTGVDKIALLQLKSALSGKLVNMVPENRKGALNSAYANAPRAITDILNRYSDNLQGIHESGYAYNKNGEWVKSGSYYSPARMHIAMNEDMNDLEYTDVLKHELGHFADHMMGSVSSSHCFTEAMNRCAAKFNASTLEGKHNLSDMLDDAFSTGACYDRNVTDIVSALLVNEPIVQKRFYQESVTGYVANYTHGNDYWNKLADDGKPLNLREKEIFANYFAIETDGYRISKNFVERWFPEIASDFAIQISGRR